MYLDKKNEFFRNIYNNRDINNIINNKYNTPFIISCPSLTFTNVDFKKLLTHYNYNITPLYTDINWLIRKIFLYPDRNKKFIKLFALFFLLYNFFTLIIYNIF